MAIKGQVFEVDIIDMTEEGAGVGKADGYPLFIKDAVVGDRVRAEVMKDKKSYAYARLIEVVTPSKDRIVPPCEVARPCGGCQLQALSYEAQLRFKEQRVKSVLERVGGVTAWDSPKGQEDAPTFYPIIGMDEPSHYRNKAEYPVRLSRDGRIVMGFYAGRTHSIIECEDCYIGQKGDAEILGIIKAWMTEYGIMPYDEESGKGVVRHIMIRTSSANGDVMVCIIVNSKKLPREEELKEYFGKCARVTSLSYCINLEKNNVIMGREVRIIAGESYIEDKIGEISYRISPQSFYQVNPVQTEKLYGAALAMSKGGYAGYESIETSLEADLEAAPSSEEDEGKSGIVWDLYCGIGTISLFLAKTAKKVYGVEMVPPAIENAKENAKLNGISNTEFFVGKAEEVLPEHFKKTGERADVIVVDPPRKGCDKVLLDTLLEMSPEKIVYVSCNPATLARDVKILSEGGYKLRQVQPVDMFPMTVHVETVCLLSNRKADAKIRIDVDLEDYYAIKDAKKSQN